MSDFGTKQVSVELSEQAGNFVVRVGENGGFKSRPFKRKEDAEKFRVEEERRLGIRF
ncbi:hypothetical protein GCM10011335_52460 [Aureimonas glaciei]|uniref:Uncharacterized protein n=1 Tax=Aureimonas glaciei TaxID=1776957 RepID=A0A916YFF1_9HYPH|nr:hypothetical protein GCM10011335_52460 [Aureimonas glaciei]